MSGTKVRRFHQPQYSVFFHDPFSEVVHKERFTLLILSGIGFAVSFAGVVPTKIAALGLESGAIKPRVLGAALAIVIGYLTCAFLYHARRSYMLWKRDAIHSVVEFLRTNEASYVDQPKRKDLAIEMGQDLSKSFFWVRSVLAWIAVDVALATAIAVAATGSLVWFAIQAG